MDPKKTRLAVFQVLLKAPQPLTHGPYDGLVIQRQQVLFEGPCPACA